MKVSLLYLLLCAIGWGATVFPRHAVITSATPAPLFPGWPGTLEGRSLEPVPLSGAEARFLRDFPGVTGSFEDSGGRWIVRWVTEPTRRLHPARHCFAGSGHDIRASGLVRDGWEQTWGSFLAQKGDVVWRVRERITDSRGNSWTDVSAWYWAALLGKTQGPWWTYTRITPP